MLGFVIGTVIAAIVSFYMHQLFKFSSDFFLLFSVLLGVCFAWIGREIINKYFP